MDVRPFLSEELCLPNGPNLDGTDSLSISDARPPLPAALTSLNVVPRAPPQSGLERSHPDIIAVYAHLPSPLDLLDQAIAPQGPFSVIARWELQQSNKDRLHPAFDQLATAKKNSSNTDSRYAFRLKRHADILIEGSTTLLVNPTRYHSVLCFGQSDGSIQFRMRDTLDLVQAEISPDVVTMPAQVGFGIQARETPCLHIALSPNATVAAVADHDGDLQTRLMEYQFGPLDVVEEEGKREAIAAALALTYTNAFVSTFFQNYFSDDVLAIIPRPLDAGKDTVHTST